MGKFADKAKESVVAVAPKEAPLTTELPIESTEPKIDSKPEDLNTNTPAIKETTPEPTIKKDEPWDGDLDKWLGTVPKDHMDALQKRIGENYASTFNKTVSEKYGKIMPLIEAIDSNPVLMDRMAQLSPFIIDEIGNDPDIIADILDLKDKEFRAFVKETAKPIHYGTSNQDPIMTKKISDLEDKLNQRERQEQEAARRAETEALSTKQRQEQEQAQQKLYDDRMTEVQALINEYPDFHYQTKEDTDKAWTLLKYITKTADDLTSANWAKGIYKVVPYSEVYQDYRNTLGTPPKAIPNTTPSGGPKPSVIKPSTQAPTTTVDSKRKLHEEIQAAGGFAKWAAKKQK